MNINELVYSYLVSNLQRGASRLEKGGIAGVNKIIELHKKEKMDNALLNKVFNGEGNFFLTEQLEIVKPDHVVSDQMSTCRFPRKLNDYLWQNDELLQPETRSAIRRLCSPAALAENACPEAFSFEWEGKVVKISKGQKIIRALRLLNEKFKVSSDEDFQKFVNKHSRILSEKAFKGELVVSRHPMDYLTASDNDAKWNSCLSIKTDGCYKYGTIETMLNDNTVVAYVQSSSQKLKWTDEETGEECTWNSKRWRQFITVDENVILANRQYPYTAPELAKAAIELIKTNLEGFEDRVVDYYHDEDFNSYDEDRRLWVKTDKMYNDFEEQEDFNYFVNFKKDWSHKDGCYELPLMTKVGLPCVCCGEDHMGSEDETYLICEVCRGDIRCSYCNDNYDIEDIVTVEVAGEERRYCRSCYEEVFKVCDICGDRHPRRGMTEVDATTLIFCNLPEALEKRVQNGSIVRICKTCRVEVDKETIVLDKDVRMTYDLAFQIASWRLDNLFNNWSEDKLTNLFDDGRVILEA